MHIQQLNTKEQDNEQIENVNLTLISCMFDS